MGNKSNDGWYEQVRKWAMRNGITKDDYAKQEKLNQKASTQELDRDQRAFMRKLDKEIAKADLRVNVEGVGAMTINDVDLMIKKGVIRVSPENPVKAAKPAIKTPAVKKSAKPVPVQDNKPMTWQGRPVEIIGKRLDEVTAKQMAGKLGDNGAVWFAKKKGTWTVAKYVA